jgi:hypothetical protein
MKSLRRFSAITVLTFAFALPAFAGEISTGVTEPPPPPSVTGQITTGVKGDAQTSGDISTPLASESSAMVTMLSLLQGVLSLL